MPDVQLLPGDCLDLLPTLAPASVDLILADLPYGTTACKWDCPIDLTRLWKEYKRVLKPRGAVVLTASQPFTSALVMSNPKWFRCEWIWYKNKGSNFGAVRYQPFKEHESVLVFAPKTPTYNPVFIPRSPNGRERTKYPRLPWKNMRPGTMGTALRKDRVETYHSRDLRYPSSVLRVNRDVRTQHPTQKPVALMAYLIRTYSSPGAVVLDNTMGSGTTGVACIETGRAFIGIERDPAYFAIAERRIAAAQPALPEAAVA